MYLDSYQNMSYPQILIPMNMIFFLKNASINPREH